MAGIKYPAVEFGYPDNGVMSLKTVVSVLTSSSEEYGATRVFVQIEGETREIEGILFSSSENSVTLIGQPVIKRTGA